MNIIGKAFSMVRGDSEDIRVTMRQNIGTDESSVFERVPFVEGDKVEIKALERPFKLYAVFPKRQSAPALKLDTKFIHKTVTEFGDGEAFIRIMPEDTEGLGFGEYVYDVQITFADGRVKTPVHDCPFSLMKEESY